MTCRPGSALRITTDILVLGDALPVLNGRPLPDPQVRVLQSQEVQRDEVPHDARRVILRYTSPLLGDGAFGVEAAPEGEGRCRVRYWVEGLPPDVPVDSFGLQFTGIENVRAFFRQGYTSWDGSYYVPILPRDSGADAGAGSEGAAETGYAATQLLPAEGKGSVVIGFDRHDRFLQTFTWMPVATGSPSLTVLTWWDRKDRAAPDRCESEWLWVLEHPAVEEGLREWARLVAAASDPPPRWGRQILGWCSWYNLYASITEQNILEHLHGAAEVAQRENLPMWVFQIDDGFTPEMGDWLLVRPQFPRGMKPLLDDIRAAGFTPGLWIAPFMVGNRSLLYREHPDWVIRDRATGGPLVRLRFYGEFRWHKRSEEYYVLDATHPSAFEYLRRVFRTWRREWGCEYFKTDFMEFGSAYGPDQAAWHTPGLTRIEIWRRVAEMIREEIGEATWVGCGCPLWPAVGLVDGMRIGRDMGVEWRGERSARSLLRDLATRSYPNGILWQADPDCVLLRDRFHLLSEAELRSLAIYAAMIGGILTTSDALHELSPARLALWATLLSPEHGGCRFPLLGESAVAFRDVPSAQDRRGDTARDLPDGLLVQVRDGAAAPGPGQPDVAAAVFVFNTGDARREAALRLDALGLPGSYYVWDYVAGRMWPAPVQELAVSIGPHDGALLFLGQAPFQAAPDRLP